MGSRSPVGLTLLAALAGMGAVAASVAQEPRFLEYARVDPEKVLGAEACGECHVSAMEVWKETVHATTFDTMHRKERAETIADKLGFRLIKRESFCFSCHYTPTVQGNRIRVISGVSCESCHGAGADWIEIHNKYGEEGKTFRTETEEHRRQRIEASRAAGMRRPSDLYEVAANCFSCHSVPNERLVNVGGHSTGTSDFELVEWSQGDMRHNFLASFREGQIGPNRTRPPERRRVMYVAGRALDLEYSLRGAAEATSEGVYQKAMSRRVRSAVAELRAVQRAEPIDEVAAMLAAVKAARVAPGNREELLAAAAEVERQTRAFLARADEAVGARLAALDPLLAGREAPVDLAEAEAEGAVAVGEVAAGGVAEEGTAPAAGGESTAAAAAGSGTSARRATPAVTGVVGELKRRIHPPSEHATLGAGACSKCHEEQNRWWFGHVHYRSADPFFAGEKKNVQIARLYGVDPREMTTGRQVCMDCHGTIVTGKESRDVLDGVSCESCHGPAGDWLEPHKDETNKELGRERPGYKAALARGKRPLDDPAVRARVCTGCHYVTEPRLLSAGHPSGADFDYAKAMTEVKHWERDLPAPVLADAFAARLAERGAVPQVRVAALPEEAGGDGGAGEPAAPRTALRADASPAELAAVRARRAQVRRRAAGLDAPAPRPAPASLAFDVELPEAAGGPLDLPPFPEIDETTPIEDALLLLRRRLRLLYDRIGPGGTGGEEGR